MRLLRDWATQAAGWLLSSGIALLLMAGSVQAVVISRSNLAQEVDLFPFNCEFAATAPELSYAKRELVRTFYQRRDYKPVWSNPERRQALASQLDSLVGDGLSPEWYGLPLLEEAAEHELCTEVLATAGYLSALQDLALGRLTRDQREPLWVAPDIASVTDAVNLVVGYGEQGLAKGDLAIAFELARPGHPLYRQLRRANLWFVQQGWEAWQPITPGPSLRPGMEDPRLPMLVARLQAQHYLHPATLIEIKDGVYREPVVGAIRAFQQDHGLTPDGIVGTRTLAALNVSLNDRRDQLAINLERLRQLLSHNASNELVVDIAGARVMYYQHNEMLWQGSAIVGRASRPTPSLVSRLSRLTFNPSWTVPPTILRHDKLPEIRKDIAYLAKNRMRVLDFEGRKLDPEIVDWTRPTGILLRQDPGPWNALGHVAFRFDNPFAVYLHDTPDRHLFDQVQRGLSSGCVRVKHALTLASILLEAPVQGPVNPVGVAEVGGKTRHVPMTAEVRLLMSYWTADGREDGRVQFKPDSYKRDRNLIGLWRQLHPLPQGVNNVAHQP